ncbi:gap junction protein alpha 4 [Alosa sapidissima]|uniref:gap junction protein alpha 4 n=1 Tax=Alosa sapidissima TaxID=34773 RepID=UPI001C0A0814|nr:gap junction protein alpha 4 [Alosa sapidissima]
MSRADWSFLEQLLEEGQENSTGVGRVWLTVLFLFRILALGTAAESAWDDEQSAFVCNTKQPGCEEVCYDQAFPVSHFRYFVLQIIFVSTPTIFYFGYVAVRARKAAERDERRQAAAEEESEERKKQLRSRSHGAGAEGGKAKLEVIQEKDEEPVVVEEETEKKEAQGGRGGGRRGAERPKLKGRLLGAYAVSIALKLALEVGFIVGLWSLYGFTVPARYECRREPCPHTVDCFVSRPTEKTIFTIYIQAIAAVSVLLNVLELLNLLQRAITQRLEKRYRRQTPWPVRATREIARAPSHLETSSETTLAPAYEERGHQYLPGIDAEAPQADQSWALEVGTGETVPGLASDLLPSYLNCISGMRPLASGGHHHRLQQHQQMHKQSKRNKHGHHKGGDPKHRHYV